jgi:DNA-binding transcriptional MerR regulator
VQESRRKDRFKLSEVCRVTDTQPYVLRFWESEFPQLSPDQGSSGQRLYRKRDIEVVRRIKQLLYEEEYSLEGARKKLADELARGKRGAPSREGARRPASQGRKADRRGSREQGPSALSSPRRKISEVAPPGVAEVETVPRQRYEDAVDEIDHLRLALKEAEKSQRRAETLADEAREAAERDRERAEKAVGHLERLVEILS